MTQLGTGPTAGEQTWPAWRDFGDPSPTPLARSDKVIRFG